MADSTPFNPLVPGFDFFQSLVKNASTAMPAMGQWVAPTLDPHEIEKRIDELKTVQFWLEQNARMLGATIQALEVQRMTLSTLETMNVQFGDLRDAMKIRVPPATEAAVAEPAPVPAPPPAAAAESEAPPATEGDAAKPGIVDPMQWWGALTKQFTEIAAAATKATATASAPAPASTGAPAAAPGAPVPGPMPKPKKAAPRQAAAKRGSPVRKRAARP